MHIDSDKLVGTYVSDRYSEKGTVTIVLTDGDSTPTREYTRYKYVQTEQLTAIGVAVKDYGAILVPETTIALFESGVLNAGDFGVFVKFNDEYYSVSLSDILSVDVITPIEFEENSFDDYPTVTFNATLPPYSVNNVGQVPTVDENGKVGWDNIPEELPSVTGNTGKFLGVNDGATGVEWKNVPSELPTIGSGDAGKVLKVNAGETGVEWGAAGGGGGGLSYKGYVIINAVNQSIPVGSSSLSGTKLRLDWYDENGNYAATAPSYSVGILQRIKIKSDYINQIYIEDFNLQGSAGGSSFIDVKNITNTAISIVAGIKVYFALFG